MPRETELHRRLEQLYRLAEHHTSTMGTWAPVDCLLRASSRAHFDALQTIEPIQAQQAQAQEAQAQAQVEQEAGEASGSGGGGVLEVKYEQRTLRNIADADGHKWCPLNTQLTTVPKVTGVMFSDVVLENTASQGTHQSAQGDCGHLQPLDHNQRLYFADFYCDRTAVTTEYQRRMHVVTLVIADKKQTQPSEYVFCKQTFRLLNWKRNPFLRYSKGGYKVRQIEPRKLRIEVFYTMSVAYLTSQLVTLKYIGRGRAYTINPDVDCTVCSIEAADPHIMEARRKRKKTAWGEPDDEPSVFGRLFVCCKQPQQQVEKEAPGRSNNNETNTNVEHLSRHQKQTQQEQAGSSRNSKEREAQVEDNTTVESMVSSSVVVPPPQPVSRQNIINTQILLSNQNSSVTWLDWLSDIHE